MSAECGRASPSRDEGLTRPTQTARHALAAWCVYAHLLITGVGIAGWSPCSFGGSARRAVFSAGSPECAGPDRYWQPGDANSANDQVFKELIRLSSLRSRAMTVLTVLASLWQLLRTPNLQRHSSASRTS